MTDAHRNAANRQRPLLAWHRPDAAKGKAAVLPMWGPCPESAELTAYDRRHLRLYTALLVALEDGTSIEDLAMGFFGFDLSRQREWALKVTCSHLRRAGWIQEQILPSLD